MRVCLKTKSAPTEIFSDECVSFNGDTAQEKPKHHPGLSFYFVGLGFLFCFLIILFHIYLKTTNHLAPKVCLQSFPSSKTDFFQFMLCGDGRGKKKKRAINQARQGYLGPLCYLDEQPSTQPYPSGRNAEPSAIRQLVKQKDIQKQK